MTSETNNHLFDLNIDTLRIATTEAGGSWNVIKNKPLWEAIHSLSQNSVELTAVYFGPCNYEEP